MAAPSATAINAPLPFAAVTPGGPEARLLAVQMLSPAFPTGAFAYSQGLEWAMAQGTVHDPASLADWLRAVLQHGAGWSDAVLLSLSLHPGADHAELAQMAEALCLSAERLTETREQGAAFARTAAALTGTDPAPAPLPVAIGRACAPLGLPAAEVIALYLHGAALNLTLAAVRFVPLGQSAGQQVLSDLAPLIARLAARAAEASEDDLGTCAYGTDLAAMAHETMQTRIFRT